MENKFEYRLGLFTFTQSELTWGQDKEIMRLFDKLRRRLGLGEELKIDRLFELLMKYDLLQEFSRIILRPKRSILRYLLFAWNIIRMRKYNHVPIDSATNSQLKKIKDDFFFLNSELINTLNSMQSVFSLIAQTLQKENEKSESQTIPLKMKMKNMNAKPNNAAPKEK